MLLSNVPPLSRFLILVMLVFLMLNLLLLSQRHTRWLHSAAVVESDNNPYVDECDGLRGSDRVVITVKTGASEAQDRIPALMTTSLRCAPNVLLFSDMEQDIGEYHLHDSLDAISHEIKDGNPDFDLYRKQYILKEAGHTDFSRPEAKFEDLRKAAWILDKYKNTHVVEKAWDLMPDREWYLHIDADTYVFMPSLVHWLRKLDHSQKIYAGSMVCTGIPFAHGGSGILVSRAATYNLAVEHNGTAALMDKKVAGLPYGDLILAHAMKDHGIPTTNAIPIINGETPWTVPFARGHWCQPVVTVHHISPAEAERLAEFEKNRAHREVCTVVEFLMERPADTNFVGAAELRRTVRRLRLENHSRPNHGRLGRHGCRGRETPHDLTPLISRRVRASMR
jgi:hypothetical protein